MSEAPSGDGHVLVLQIEAENRLEEIDRVIREFETFSKAHAVPDEIRRIMNVALDELLNNVIAYGFEDGDLHLIGLRFELSPHALALQVSDDGRPFNPLRKSPPDVTLGIEEREPGGLGIHLLRKLMDEISYRRDSDRNVLVLVKRLSSGGHEIEREDP